MNRNSLAFVLSLALILPEFSVAQNGAPVRPNPGTYPPGTPGQAGQNGRGGHCLQQAGLSQSTMQRVRSIRESARAQIEALCSNTSLTAQQRQQQIRQIHEQTRQQVSGLISSAQEQKIQACQGGGRGAGHGGGGPGGGGQGPCGSLPGQHLNQDPGEPAHN